MIPKNSLHKKLMTRDDITAAVEESQDVKKKYPHFWMFYEMLLDLNNASGNFDLEEEKNVNRKY